MYTVVGDLLPSDETEKSINPLVTGRESLVADFLISGCSLFRVP